MLAGIGSIAHMGNAPIVPCVILGSDRLYDWKRLNPFRRVPIWVGFGPALDLDPTLDKHQAREKLEADLARSLRDLLGEMRGAFNLTEEDLPQPPARRKGRPEPDHPHKRA